MLGAELGAVAALVGIPALLDENVPGQIAAIFSTKEEWFDTLQVIHGQGLWIGLWIGIVGGAYITLRMIRVEDRPWTTFLLAILALLAVTSVLKPYYDENSANLADLSTFDFIGPQLVQTVAIIALLARGTTRLARNRRL